MYLEEPNTGKTVFIGGLFAAQTSRDWCACSLCLRIPKNSKMAIAHASPTSNFDFSENNVLDLFVPQRKSNQKPTKMSAASARGEPRPNKQNQNPSKKATKRKMKLSRTHMLFFNQRIFADHLAPARTRTHWRTLAEKSVRFQKESICVLPGIGEIWGIDSGVQY